MDEKFLSSGIFQFLDEISGYRGPLFDYGFLIGKDELAFDEELMENKIDLHNALKRTDKKLSYTRNSGLMDRPLERFESFDHESFQ